MDTTSGKRPSSIGNPSSQRQDRGTVKKTIESYKNHPGVATIKENLLPDSLSFDLPPASKEDINKVVKLLTANKAHRLNWLNILPTLLTNILLVS